MSAETEITQILTSQRTLADSLINQAQSQAAGTIDAINRLSDPEYDEEDPAFGDEGRTPSLIAPSGIFQVTDPAERETSAGVTDIPEYLTPYYAPDLPEQATEFREIGEVNTTSPPDDDDLLDLRSRTLEFPGDPGTEVKGFQDAAPTIDTDVQDIEFPDIATAFEPLALIDIEVPSDDVTVDTPDFTDERPTFLGTTPSSGAYTNTLREEFASGLALAESSTEAWLNQHFPGYALQVQALDEHLNAGLAGTSTAWSERVLAAIYNRRRTQTEAEAARTREQIERGIARSGFLTDLAAPLAQARAEQAAHNANVQAAYDVAERAAERETAYLESIRAMLNQNRLTAVTLEQQQQQLVLAKNQFALGYAQAIVQTSIQAHNDAVQRYNADIGRYGTDAQVYQVKFRAAFAELEILKEKLEVARLKSQTNRDLIADLEARIRVEQSKLQLYTGKTQALLAQAELRRLPLEQFRANIEAHREYLAGRELETNIYSAIVAGRRGEIDADLAKIRVHDARVDLWAKRSAVLKENEAFNLDVNRGIIDQENLALARLREQLAIAQQKNTAERGFDSVRNQRWAELLRRDISEEELSLRRDIASSDLRARYDAFGLDWAKANIDLNLKKMETQVRVLESITSILSELGSATLAANGSTVALINETQNSG